MTRRGGDQPRLFATGSAQTARVRRYVDRQLKAQRQLGQLEPVDDGLVGVVMTMADTIDREIRNDDGSAWVVITGLAKLTPVLLELRGERHDGAGGGLDVELEQLAAAVRDAEGSGPPEPR